MWGGGGGVGRRKLFVLELLFPASGLLGPTGSGCLPLLYSHQGRSLKGLAWGLVPAPDARRLSAYWTLP